MNATITGVKFLFDVTLDRPELLARMRPVKVPRTLPIVLSVHEVSRLIAAAHNVKHQVALSVAYGAGLRASEVVGLRVTDIDGQRMTLRVEQGKGRKDQYAMLSPVLLRRLRTWWRVGHALGKIKPCGWLFPCLDPTNPWSTRQLNRAVHDAADAARLNKRVTTNTLRHCFATHLLERKVDVRVIQVLLGHRKNWRRRRSIPTWPPICCARSSALWSSCRRRRPRRVGRPGLEVADIFHQYGPAWREAQRGHLSLGQLKVMSAIEQCRREALGGHVLRCEGCGSDQIAYNSCRNRHCPKCQSSAAQRWLDARQADLSLNR